MASHVAGSGSPSDAGEGRLEQPSDGAELEPPMAEINGLLDPPRLQLVLQSSLTPFDQAMSWCTEQLSQADGSWGGDNSIHFSCQQLPAALEYQ